MVDIEAQSVFEQKEAYPVNLFTLNWIILKCLFRKTFINCAVEVSHISDLIRR